MNTLLRWLWSAIDSIPCRTTRAVGAAYVEGYLEGVKSLGIERDAKGRFVSLHPKHLPLRDMIGVSSANENRGTSVKRTDSNVGESLFT